MSAAATNAWLYQPPHHPVDYPSQCYYRTASGRHSMVRAKLPGAGDVTIFRFADQKHVQVEIDVGAARVQADLDAPALLALRNAIDDALHDIAQLPPVMPPDDCAAERSSEYAGESFA